MNMNNRIRVERAEARITQQELANTLGKNQSTVANKLRGISLGY